MQSSKSNPSSLNPRKFDEKIALLQAGETESNEKFNRLLDELNVLKNRLSTGEQARRTVSTPNVAGGVNGAAGSPAPSVTEGVAQAPTPVLSSSSSNIAAPAAVAAIGGVHHPHPLSLSPQHQVYNNNNSANSPAQSPSPGGYYASQTGYALSPAAQQHTSTTKHRVREYIISKSRDHRAHPYSPTHQRSRDEYDEHAGAGFSFGFGGVATSNTGAAAGAGGLGPPLGPRRASSDTNIVEKLQQQGLVDFYASALGSGGGVCGGGSGDFSASAAGYQQALLMQPPPMHVPIPGQLLQQQLLQLQQQQPIMLQTDMTRLSLATPPLQSAGSPAAHPSLVAALLSAPASANGINSHNRSSWHHYQQVAQSNEDLPAMPVAPSPNSPLLLPQSPSGPIPDIRVTPISQSMAMPPPPPPPPPPLNANSHQMPPLTAAYATSDFATAAAQHFDNGCGVRRDSYTMATEVLASLATAGPTAGADSGRFNVEQQTDGFTF